MNGTDFTRRLEELINEYSMENESNTPDFVLAEYLRKCMQNFAEATKARDKWYTEGGEGG